jgi:hypothetical protein
LHADLGYAQLSERLAPTDPERRVWHEVTDLVRLLTDAPSLIGHRFDSSTLVEPAPYGDDIPGLGTWQIRPRDPAAQLWEAESSLRELGTVSLEDAPGYLDLLAEQKPEKLERAAVRWHGRLETEATILTLAGSQLVLAALASLCAGERDAIEVLRRLLRRVRPTLMPQTR